MCERSPITNGLLTDPTDLIARDRHGDRLAVESYKSELTGNAVKSPRRPARPDRKFSKYIQKTYQGVAV
jgi:hypothetical protein